MAEPHNSTNKGEEVATQWDRIEQRRKEAGVSHARLCLDADYSHSAWRKWRDRNDLPRKVLNRLAQCFTEKYGLHTTAKWLDEGDTGALPKPSDYELTLNLLKALRQVCIEEEITPTDELVADVFSRLHNLFQQVGYVDIDWVRFHARSSAGRNR